MFQILFITAVLIACVSGGGKPSHSSCPPVCPPNEVYLKCGTCEGTCSDPDPICTMECRPPGCYCLKCQGYVRGPKGICIPKSECPGCPASSTIFPSSTLSGSPSGTPSGTPPIGTTQPPTGTTPLPTQTIPSETVPSMSTPLTTPA
ncbi:hypothetical protein QR680_016183 [Steinernema hermaphroditum]|uniref:TIL domain-containing protein n=1 Tax=Steinernema hermaphroditum TaxID=289476 RepID=A0AA39LLJ0_9BILA|nr:hypothetical protein QR680_016183 [Steinernema hermaphroditum]